MIENILEQLDERLSCALQRWKYHLQHSGCDEASFVHRYDAAKAYNSLIALLRQYTSDKPLPSVDRLSEQLQQNQCFFITIAREQQTHGSTTAMCLCFIKSLRTVIEEQLGEILSTETEKNLARSLLYRVCDSIETAIVADVEQRNIQQSYRDLQQLNRQLSREKSTYESIFEATSNIVLLTDEEGMIIEANPEAKVFFSGRKLLGCFCGVVLGICDTSLDDLLLQTPPNRLHEINLKRDGFPQVFNLQILPLDQTSLSSQGVLILLSDITCMADHRQALEMRVAERTRALANSEKMLDAVFQSVGKGILLIDSEREIVKANQQASEMYGIPLEVMVGTPFCALTDTDGCRKLTQISESLPEGERQRIEVTSLYVDGTTFPSEITMTRMDRDGQRFWPVIVRDITEQRALEDGLRAEKLQSEEMNVTLRNVLKSIEDDRRKFEQDLNQRIRTGLLPAIEKIRYERESAVQSTYLDMLKGQLIALTTGFDSELDAEMLKLSKSELKVCRYIKAGMTGKEICDAMNLSFETIQTHRKNIRKKLGLRGREVNLHTFLANRNCHMDTPDNNHEPDSERT